MKAFEISQGLYWVGALDPKLRTFDVIMHTATGTSYNSYLVQGEKTAVVEAVKERFYDEWIARLADAGVKPADIDYLVLNHTEPDHSGAVRRLLSDAPHVKIVCSRPASLLIKEITNEELDIQVVNDGDEVSLGGETLRFISAPFLHWPDSMFTYAVNHKALITGDVFGFHHCAGGVFDDSEDMDKLYDSQKYYYDVIMSPFAPYVQQAVEKTRALAYDVICPSHGPVLRTNPQAAVDNYDNWSKPQPKAGKPTALVAYVSCYGYTGVLADAIADELAAKGVDVQLKDIEQEGVDVCAALAMQSDIVFVGSPTVNRDALPPVWDMMTRISAIAAKGRIGATFGSFGWSGEASKFLLERMNGLGFKTAGNIRTKMYPSDEALAEARDLAEKAVEML